MPIAQFKEVILGPAARSTAAGRPVRVQPELVERLLAESAEGADTLPLLSLTLARLYADFEGAGELTVNGYKAIGGMSSVVQTEIDAILARDPIERQVQLEHLHSAFVPWLATINPDNDQPMRRVANLSDIPTQARGLIDTFVARRLLIKDVRGGEIVVEVALESLLRQWKELAYWLAAEREDLKEADNLERAAAAWESSSRAHAWLLEGARLTGAESLASKPAFRNRLKNVRTFLIASRRRENDRIVATKQAELKAARDKQEAAERQAAEVRKQARALRTLLAAVTLIAVVAIIGFVQASITAGDAAAGTCQASSLPPASEGWTVSGEGRINGAMGGVQHVSNLQVPTEAVGDALTKRQSVVSRATFGPTAAG
jgi:hypothetical protein